jgi:hypothetical protein
MSARPDLDNCLRPLLSLVPSSQIHCLEVTLTPSCLSLLSPLIEARNSRAVPAEELKNLLFQLENESDREGSREEPAHSRKGESMDPLFDAEGRPSKHCSFHLGEAVPSTVPDAILPIRRVLLEAVSLAVERKEVLVVCGTAFIMADVRSLLGIDEPRDELD